MSATTTRISRGSARATGRLRSRDKLGELAAALDGLAETLREEQTPRQSNIAAFTDPAEWLPTLSRFNRTLQACLDSSSIERLLVETVEEVFPACAIALCLNDKSRSLPSLEYPDLDEELRSPIPEAQRASAPIFPAPAELKMPSQRRNTLYPPKTELSGKRGCMPYVTIPLLARGDMLGTLTVYGRDGANFTPGAVDFLNILADQAALAMKFQLIEQGKGQTAQSHRANDGSGNGDGTRSDLVSIMSHEFRTPLNLIMGYTEMMREGLMGRITSEQGKCLDRIMKASDDLLALIINMLQVANIEFGCVEVNKEKVGLSQFLGEIQSDFVPPKEKGLEFIWDIPADLPMISTDPDKLRHVVEHLIDNAAKFTERGQVMVSSRTVLPAEKVEITVSDTGVGIPEHVLPVLFEKYRQLDSSIARTYDGMGLGLFIAKRLTEVLGGELNVTSHPGRGSTFTVALPSGSQRPRNLEFGA